MDDRLAITVHHADGRSTRWGPGELDAGRIANDLSFSTAAPGGFREASCSLLRDIQPQEDEGLLDSVTVYGPGGQIAWEGRIQQLPRETGQANRMSPQAVGHSAHLADKKSVRQIFVDRDMGQLRPTTLNERIRLATLGTPYDIATPTWSVGEGAMMMTGSGALPGHYSNQLWYIAPPGVAIKHVTYLGTNVSWPADDGVTLRFHPTDTLSGGTTSSALTFDAAIHTITAATARRYVAFEASNGDGVVRTPADGAHRRITQFAVYGDHGLTRHTTAAGEPDGLYASDIIAYVIENYAPLLNYTTGADGSIQPTSYAIPQASYPALTTADAIIADVNKYHGWDWLVYDNRTFHYREAGSGVEWRARRQDGANLRLDGETSDVIVNAIYVSYTDGFGNQRLAGPPGSGADVTDASLQDTSDTHPVNQAGIPEKSELLSLSQPTTDAGAVVIGALALYERNVATRRGQITLTGLVEHPTEGKVPCWRVRAGDSIIVGDLPGDVPRRIISTDYQHSTRTITASLDNQPAVLEALMERLVVGQGGL